MPGRGQGDSWRNPLLNSLPDPLVPSGCPPFFSANSNNGANRGGQLNHSRATGTFPHTPPTLSLCHLFKIRILRPP